MKRYVSFILAFIMILGNVASAAPGDIIHLGTGNLYRQGVDEEKLVNDIVNGIDLKEFYKEIEPLDGVQQFVNIVEREKAQEDYMMGIMRDNNITSPKDLEDYMLDPKNNVKENLDAIAKGDPKTFDEDTLEKFFGSSKAPILKLGTDYSLPVPGSVDYTLKITKLDLPKEANSWIAKVLPEALVDLNIDKVFEGYSEFKLNDNFSIKDEDDKIGKYLFLAAIDKDGRLKAYENIEILDSMFNIPKIEVNPDDSIEVKFEKSVEYSGHTLLSGNLGEGSWKVAIVNELPGKIYTDSKFNSSVDYINGMELLVANDEDLNKGLDDFEKFAIVYSLNGRLIESYKTFTLNKDKVSGLLEAKTLIEKSDDEDNFNYTKPIKGNDPSTIQIKELILPEGASSWKYDIVTNDKAPIRHRVYEGNAKPLEEVKDIKITSDKKLMILALDDNSKVTAYAIVDIEEGMIKNEPPFLLQSPSHYRDLKKGVDPGKSNIILSSSPALDKKFDTQPPNITWRYLLSDKKLSLPEAGSFMEGTTQLTSGEDFILVADTENLKLDENFNKHLLILATEGGEDNFKIRGYGQIPLTREHIRYPKAGELSQSTHYSKPEKGPNPGTTKISDLTPSGIDDHSSWWYKIVEGLDEASKPEPIEYKHLLNRSEGFIQYSNPGSPINAKAGDYIVLVAADKNRKALAYDSIKLTEDQVTAPTATLLRSPTHYSKLEFGTKENTTRFVNLYPEIAPDSDNVKWMVKVGDNTFGQIESGINGKDAKYGFIEYKAMDNIENVSPGKWLLLVRTDKDFNINGYVNIALRPEHIRNNNAQKMTTSNYKVSKGDRAANTKIHSLNHGGIDAPNFNGWKWMYKLIDEELTGENIPYINQKLNGIDLAKDGNIDLGNKTSGYILLLATDNSGQTKAYAHIEINDDMISKPAAKLNVSIKPGNSIDRIKFDGEENSYMYKMDTKEIPSPAMDEILYGAQEYQDVAKNVGIIAKAGSHLTIYEVDGDSKVKAFKSMVIKDTDIKKGLVEIDKTPILEGDIKIGGPIISFTLKDNDEWNDVKFDQEIRNKLYDGLVADKENTQWIKVVNTLKAAGPGNIFIEGKKVIIRLPATPGYDISEEQKISLTVPAVAVEDAVSPIVASGQVTIKPTIEASVSGSVVTDIVRQKDIEKGGATIEVKLKDAYWAFDVKDVLSNSYVGMKDSAQDSTNWAKIKAEVKNKPDSVIVTDANTIRITLPPVSELNYGSDKETVTLNIDGKFIQGSEAGDEIVAGPTFTIYPDVLKIKTELVDPDNKVIMEAPDNKTPLKDNDTWKVKLTNAKLKEEIKNTDIEIIGMPAGLKYLVSRLSDTELSIKMTGSASKGVNNGNIRLIVKGSAVEELNSIDSDPLSLPYVLGSTLDLKEINYKIVKDTEKEGIYLELPPGIAHKDIQYSINSSDGIKGEWDDLVEGGKVSDLIGPVTIFVREKDQIKSFHRVVDLNHPKAPLVSVEGYKYDFKDGSYLATVTLKSGEKDLEYSKDNGLNWTPVAIVPDSDLITVTELNKLSVLLFRTKEKAGINGVLPSLATGQLNGLFLGDVKLDVSQRKILGATRDMKYKLSADGTWNNINTNDPVVDFKEGNKVWISEGKNEINARELGEVKQTKVEDLDLILIKNDLKVEDLEDESKKGIYYHVGERKIVNKTGVSLQYNITKGAVPAGNWYDLKNTASNVNFMPGNIFVRKVDDGSSLPSNPIKLFEVAESIAPPKIEVNQDDKTLLYESENGSYSKLDSTFEYRIDNGDYQDGDLLATDAKRLGNVKVYVKRKATKDLLQSKEISFTFTENISLANVRVNVAEGLIEGTTNKMEYRTDANSPWKVASPNKTSINMYEGMNIWIRELGKPSTSKMILEDLKKMNKPKADKLQYDVSQKFINNSSKVILEYRINNDPWKPINVGQTIDIEFVPTKLSIRTKATTDTLASDVVEVIKDLAYPDAGPVVKIDDGLNKVESIDSDDTSWAIYEFKLKSQTEWMPGENLKSYDLSGDKVLQIRKTGDSNQLPSEITEVIFTRNISMGNVKLLDTSPLKLVGTELEMEYQIYLNDKEIPNTWTKASLGTTNLDSKVKKEDINLIVVRDSRNISKKDNNYKIFKIIDNAIQDGTLDDLPVELKDISYKITSSGIEFTGISDKMKYKSSLDPNWKIGDENNVVINQLEIVEFTIADNRHPSITRTITVSERADTPDVTVSNVTYSGTDMMLTLQGFDKDTMEYSIDDGSWESKDETTGDGIVRVNKDNKLIVRKKLIETKEGETGKLPSLPTKNLNPTSLLGVGVSMQMDKTKLVNTTQFMEYSLDSTNGQDGKWTKANDNETFVELKLGSLIWIREIKVPGNAIKIGPIGQEPIPVLPKDMIYFNISNARIANFTSQKLEYKVAGGSWNPINVKLDGSDAIFAFDIDFKAGPLAFRRAATDSNFASKPVVFTTIQIAGSAPRLKYNDIENTVDFSGLVKAEYEYRITINGITSKWANASNLETEDLSGERIVEIRKLATDKDLASEIQKLTFTNNPLKQVNLSSHVKPFELNGTTNKMQYRVNSSESWLDCSNMITILKSPKGKELSTIGSIDLIEVRYAAPDQQHNIFTVYKK